MYSFSIEDFAIKANIQKTWKKGSEKLLSPAIIANVEENKNSKQIVLEFNKPNHYRSASGIMVILYRREAAGSRPAI